MILVQGCLPAEGKSLRLLLAHGGDCDGHIQRDLCGAGGSGGKKKKSDCLELMISGYC